MPPPRPPIVAGRLEPAGPISLVDEMEIEDVEVSGDLTGRDASDIEVSGCSVKGARLTGVHLERLRITDTMLSGCDLAGAGLGGASLRRVEFRDCRLSGIDLSAASLEDVSFTQCKLDAANLRMIAGVRVQFEDCDLRGADFYGAKLPGLRCFRSDLREAEVSKANLRDARLHGSTLGGITGTADLAGAAIDSGQLVPLALWLAAAAGVSIDDDPDD